VDTYFTKEKLKEAFEFMGQTAAERGIVLEIAVYGGSCLILASDIRNASGDVDAVFLTNRPVVREISDLAARKLNLAVGWLKEGVKSYAPPIGNPHPTLFPFGDYPTKTKTGVGLRVHLPTPEYMLAMKLLSARSDEDLEETQSDQSDAIGLMKITGKTTKEDLLLLVEECYPRIPGIILNGALRIRAKIETYVDAYTTSTDPMFPTWNARRGPPIQGR